MPAQGISKSALITGCSTGIGHATALWLAERGWKVYATARRREALADLEGKVAATLALDVCDESSMVSAVRNVEERDGAVGVLVNNAGYGQEGAFEEVAMDKIRLQFETNVFGLIRLTQIVLPRMRRQGWGRIVNVSSMGGKLTLPGGAFYHATKHAVEALSDALRIEVAPFGVGVVVIEPGPVSTRFGETATESMKQLLGDPASPYAGLNRAIARGIEDAYEGRMKAFAAPPGAVARAIERAITSARPRPRYVVTAAARVLLGLKWLLPDRAFDSLLRLQLRSLGA
ncbi:MAG TPA: oxidoreductase [Candidatus Binatia bacterium]|nr:oxidoreductase [Candidatus Binatia bacterium]